MHVAASPLRGDMNFDWHLINFFTCLGFTAVPLFLMMSGHLLLTSEKTLDISVLLKKRLPHLAIPLAGWTVVAVLWRWLTSSDHSLSAIYDGLVSSLSSPAWVHFWYMYSLIAFYLLSPIICGGLRALDKKGHILVLTIIALISLRTILRLFLPESVAVFLNIDALNKLTPFGGYLATFILGYYLGNLKQRIPNIILISASVIILGIIVFGTYYLTATTGEFNQNFQSQASGFEVVLASCIFLLFKQNMDKESKVLKHIPIVPLSLSIYLMHNILLSMMGYISIFSATTFLRTVFVTASNFAICFITMKTVTTIKPICYLASGMTYEAACKTCNWVYTYNKIKKALRDKKK